MEDRGIGCKTCLVNKGVVSPEECIGCNGQKDCNEDYFPTRPKENVGVKPSKQNIFTKLFKKKEQKFYIIG